MLMFSNKSGRKLLFFCVLAIVCLSLTASAQSGRKVKKNTVSLTQTAPSEVKPAEEPKAPEAKTRTPEDEKAERIASVLIVGEEQLEAAYYKSNYLQISLREFIEFTKMVSKKAPEMARGEKKLNYTEAKEQAKKETDKHVLWIGFALKNDSYGGVYIDFLQYAILKPQTGEVLTRGQFTPGTSELGKPTVVAQVPVIRRRTLTLTDMNNSVRELSAILLRGGWFG